MNDEPASEMGGSDKTPGAGDAGGAHGGGDESADGAGGAHGGDAHPSPDGSHPPPDGDVGLGLLDESMGPSSALAHLYRGELHRTKFWRERLDRTTNWAVILIAAVLTWSFSSASHPHYVVLVGVAALTVFLVVEARRYRGYDIWRSRVRDLQRNVFAPGLDPDREPAAGWRERLSQAYAEPEPTVTPEEAVAHRLRRIYLPLVAVVLVAWGIRVTAFAAVPWPDSAAVGSVPGLAVTAVVAGYALAAVVVAFRPRTWHGDEELRHDERA